MCIIIAKYRNGRLPKKNELKNSFEYNSDGAGFMYVNNGKVVIDKGYMDFDSFYKRFNDLCKKYNDFKNKSLVIHCRIGTSSGNTPQNTHPYPMSKKEKDLHKKYTTTNLGIAHNGIISSFTPKGAKPTTNDTQEFIMKYLAPIYDEYKDCYKNKDFLEGIHKVTNSKFAFLDTNDKIYLSGKSEFIEEDKGLFFSNNSYEITLTPKKYFYNDYILDSYFDENYNDDYSFSDFVRSKKEKDEDDFDYLEVCDENGESLKYVVCKQELVFLDSSDYIYIGENKCKEIGNDFTAYDIDNYDLYEVVGGKAYLIGNIYDDEIEIFDSEYERII